MPESTNHDRLESLGGPSRTRTFLRALATRRRAGVLTIETDRSDRLARLTVVPPRRHGVAVARVSDPTSALPGLEPFSAPSPTERPAPRPTAQRGQVAASGGPAVAAPRPAPAEGREETLWERVTEAPGRTLDHATTTALQRPGPGAPPPPPRPGRIRFVDNEAADELARRHRADAVTRGTVVAARTDRFRPRSPEGLGLLAHELVHAAAADAPPAARPAPAVEERAALAREIATISAVAPPPPLRAAPAPAPVPAPAPLAAAAASGPAVRRAAEDRWTRPPGADSAAAQAPALSAETLRALEERLARRLIARIKTDMERGV